MKLDVDISWQISQLYKSGKNNRNKGSGLAIVSHDKKYRVGVYLAKDECVKIIDYLLSKGFTKKQAFLRTHVEMIRMGILELLSEKSKEIEKINICRDFSAHLLSMSLKEIIPELDNFKVKWNGGKGNKSSADKYANFIRENPNEANHTLTLEKIKMEMPCKGK